MQKSRQQLIVVTMGLVAVAALALIPAASARQSSTSSQQSSAQNADSSAAAQSTQQQDPLAAAARKAKEQQNHAKPAKVFTNDNMPTNGVISTVGSAPAADSTAPGDAKTAAAPAAQGEQYWRDKFSTLNKKLEQDQGELDVMQRELGQLNLQNYSDPNQAMQQGYSRSDIDKKASDISAKQKEIEADKQALSDAESDLRKSGGDSGWAR